MQACRCVVFALVALTLSALSARAQDANAVEITPYVALSGDATAPVGAAITIPVTATLSVETDMAYRRSQGLPTLSLSTSLLWLLPHVGQATPYLAAGVGLTQYRALAYSINGGPLTGGEQRLGRTMNVGGGLKMPMSDTLDSRTDARWLIGPGFRGDQIRLAQGISFDVGKR